MQKLLKCNGNNVGSNNILFMNKLQKYLCDTNPENNEKKNNNNNDKYMKIKYLGNRNLENKDKIPQSKKYKRNFLDNSIMSK